MQQDLLRKMYGYRAEYLMDEITNHLNMTGRSYLTCDDEDKVTSQHYFGHKSVDEVIDLLQIGDEVRSSCVSFFSLTRIVCTF